MLFRNFRIGENHNTRGLSVKPLNGIDRLSLFPLFQNRVEVCFFVKIGGDTQQPFWLVNHDQMFIFVKKTHLLIEKLDVFADGNRLPLGNNSIPMLDNSP